MSRVGKKPVEIPNGVSLSVQGSTVSGKGPQGELKLQLPEGITASVTDKLVTVSRANELVHTRCCHGLARSLIANMVQGLVKGYLAELEIQGVGFKAALQGQKLQLWLGFSAPVDYTVPAGIKLKVDNGTAITISGPDKQLVGDVTARIRSFAPAEPYKGKGIRRKGEHIRRKVGKTVA